MRELRTELRINGYKYDADDWNEINEKHAEINEELEEFELTEQEAKLVEKLNAEILGYRQKYNIGDAVGGLVNSVAQAIDDATGLNTSVFAKTLTESAPSAQHQIEKQAKSIFRTRVAWIGGVLLLGFLCYLAIILFKAPTVKRRSHTKRRR